MISNIYEDYLEATMDDSTSEICEFHEKNPGTILSFPLNCKCKSVWKRRPATESERRSNRVERLKRRKLNIEQELVGINAELHNLCRT